MIRATFPNTQMVTLRLTIYCKSKDNVNTMSTPLSTSYSERPFQLRHRNKIAVNDCSIEGATAQNQEMLSLRISFNIAVNHRLDVSMEKSHNQSCRIHGQIEVCCNIEGDTDEQQSI